ncbi:hypothetical protein FHX48_000928 [Microbacterium halimionae]|uniref:DUF5058 family protein n=1 Tax=Microbacterium halimionae TaxID=1526413 RepID=A0A7W3PLD0_9MICO|nr:DUF5058 family protein [Microbacterium halimionae]MBA8815876.1 hypothetical protein [Microbacterium halimionae]NII95922.1 hypothetical protein [Microbacterium halimionae]
MNLLHQSVDADSTDILAIANSPVLWICALSVLAVIVIQSVIYFLAVRRVSPDAGLTPSDSAKAMRTGAFAAIGPSLAVAMIAIALISLFGTPATLVRIGLIGSAPYETLSASIATNVQGATLGGEGYTQGVFAVALLAMAIAGSMWMIVTLIATPFLSRGSVKLSKANPLVMTIIPAAALAGAFFTNVLIEGAKGWINAVVVIVSAGIVALAVFLAKRLRAGWLQEWALGFGIIGSVLVAYALSSATA